MSTKNIKIPENILFKFSANLLKEYKIPIEFEKDGEFLLSNIWKVGAKSNIDVVKEQIVRKIKNK